MAKYILLQSRAVCVCACKCVRNLRGLHRQDPTLTSVSQAVQLLRQTVSAPQYML